MSSFEIRLADGLHLVYPRTEPPLTPTVVLTVLRTTTGGGTMLEGGVVDVPIDIDTTLEQCEIMEGDYISIFMGKIHSIACEACSNVLDCPWTGVVK